MQEPLQREMKTKRLLFIWREKGVLTTISKQHGLSNLLSNFSMNPTVVLQYVCGKISFIYQKTFTGRQPILILIPSYPRFKKLYIIFVGLILFSFNFQPLKGMSLYLFD